MIRQQHDTQSYLLIYVVDILLIGNDNTTLAKILQAIQHRFKMRNLVSLFYVFVI